MSLMPQIKGTLIKIERFKMLDLDERSLYLRHEGHKMKLKFITPRQVSKNQHRLKEKIEKERIEKEEI